MDTEQGLAAMSADELRECLRTIISDWSHASEDDPETMKIFYNDMGDTLDDWGISPTQVYEVAVYYRGDDRAWRFYGTWSGRAESEDEAIREALDASIDERIDGWKAEVI